MTTNAQPVTAPAPPYHALDLFDAALFPSTLTATAPAWMDDPRCHAFLREILDGLHEANANANESVCPPIERESPPAKLQHD